MANKIAQFNGLLRAKSSIDDPSQSILEFVFTDFNPNKNKQGVQESEAANIIRTGLYKPLKVDFLGDSLGDHDNALPAGAITSMSQQDDKIIGTAIVWRSEFPDFVDYLETASEKDSGVQFSWELYYKDSIIDDIGTEWLQGCIVRAITAVGNPAYAGRTPLLSFASEKSKQQLATALSNKVAQAIGNLNTIEEEQSDMDLTIEGLRTEVDNITNILYDMVSQLYTALDEATEFTPTDVASVTEAYTSLITRLSNMKAESAATTSALESANSELEELRNFKQEVENGQARAALINTRSTELSGLMSQEEIDTKLDFILELSDTQFASFVQSLQTVSAKKVSNSSIRTLIPDSLTNTTNGTKQLNLRDIAQEFNKLRTAKTLD